MKQITKELDNKLDISEFFPDYSNDQILFFDIETTGFSPLKDDLYLIGCISFYDNKWILTQFFAETPEDQSEIQDLFCCFCKKFTVIIHFNGDSFDIPFITNKLSQRQVNTCFDDKISIDLLKSVRPFQNILGLENCKLKSIEEFLGIYREDKYSGKDLIEQYKSYVESHDPNLEKNILLHNEEDLCGLRDILMIEQSIHFIMRLQNKEIGYSLKNIALTHDELLFTAVLNEACPFELSITNSFYRLRIKKNDRSMYISIDLFEGTLYHYFDNYKDYYYLPDQDEAIHKSVGRFIPTDRRRSASASTCYIKKHGHFMPMFKIVPHISSFLQKPKDKNVFVLLENHTIDDLLRIWLDQCFMQLNN